MRTGRSCRSCLTEHDAKYWRASRPRRSSLRIVAWVLLPFWALLSGWLIECTLYTLGATSLSSVFSTTLRETPTAPAISRWLMPGRLGFRSKPCQGY